MLSLETLPGVKSVSQSLCHSLCHFNLTLLQWMSGCLGRHLCAGGNLA